MFGKCVLNVLASKLKAAKGKADKISRPYQLGYNPSNLKRFPVRQKAEMIEIADDGIAKLN